MIFVKRFRPGALFIFENLDSFIPKEQSNLKLSFGGNHEKEKPSPEATVAYA